MPSNSEENAPRSAPATLTTYSVATLHIPKEQPQNTSSTLVRHRIMLSIHPQDDRVYSPK